MSKCLHPLGLLALDSGVANGEDTRLAVRHAVWEGAQTEQYLAQLAWLKRIHDGGSLSIKRAARH